MRAIFNTYRHRSLLIWPLLLTGAAATANPTKVQCVLLENAQIARQRVAKEGEFGRANYGHQIDAGARSVLAVRIFEDDNKGPDSGRFKKATLEFKSSPDIATGEKVTVKVLRSYYAQGGSAWVEDGGYTWATNPFNQVRMGRTVDGLHVHLKSIFEATNESALTKNRRKERIQVDVQCPVRRQTVMELSQWVGRVGTNRQSFYDLE